MPIDCSVRVGGVWAPGGPDLRSLFSGRWRSGETFGRRALSPRPLGPCGGGGPVGRSLPPVPCCRPGRSAYVSDTPFTFSNHTAEKVASAVHQSTARQASTVKQVSSDLGTGRPTLAIERKRKHKETSKRIPHWMFVGPVRPGQLSGRV